MIDRSCQDGNCCRKKSNNNKEDDGNVHCNNNDVIRRLYKRSNGREYVRKIKTNENLISYLLFGL